VRYFISNLLTLVSGDAHSVDAGGGPVAGYAKRFIPASLGLLLLVRCKSGRKTNWRRGAVWLSLIYFKPFPHALSKVPEEGKKHKAPREKGGMCD
jgi:hypothetical protein